MELSDAAHRASVKPRSGLRKARWHRQFDERLVAAEIVDVK
jgi:hypothetical protein